MTPMDVPSEAQIAVTVNYLLSAHHSLWFKEPRLTAERNGFAMRSRKVSVPESARAAKLKLCRSIASISVERVLIRHERGAGGGQQDSMRKKDLKERV